MSEQEWEPRMCSCGAMTLDAMSHEPDCEYRKSVAERDSKRVDAGARVGACVDPTWPSQPWWKK